MSEVRVRFAPSPTGLLHIGGARTALFNYLFARRSGGKFVLRIDDTDSERSRKDYEEDITAGLKWLGVTPDESPQLGGPAVYYRQSERFENHRRTAQLLLDSSVARRDDDGTIRLTYGSKPIEFEDAICGKCRFLPRSLGPEPVLVRADGIPTYHLASVSDDIEMSISHIIRGQDHLTNTAKHVRIFTALGHDLPVFAHLPLILGQDGAKLSKRNSDALTSLSDFRAAGYLAEAVVNFLVLLGWSHPEAKEQLTLTEASECFDLTRVSHTAAVFDLQKLDFLNGWWVRHIELNELIERGNEFLGEYREVVSRVAAGRWQQIVGDLRMEISGLKGIEKVAEMVFAEEIPLESAVIEALEKEVKQESISTVARTWAALISEFPTDGASETYSEQEVGQLLSQMKKRCGGLSGKELYKPLRLVCLSATSGPELKTILKYISRRNLITRAGYVIKTIAC